jgi:hypothetical protein
MKSTLKALAAISPLVMGSLLFSSPARAADYYGAIAYSPSTRAWGWSADFDSMVAAQAVAEQKCRDASDNARDCRWVVWFQNACGALGIGNTSWGADWGSSELEAKYNALLACNDYSCGCEIAVTVCTTNAGASDSATSEANADGGTRRE